MNEITESQNIFLSAFGQIPDEFKPIVLLAVAGLIIVSFYLWKTNNGLISCIKRALEKNKNEKQQTISAEITKYDSDIVNLKQDVSSVVTENNIIKTELDGVKTEILKLRTSIDRISNSNEMAIAAMNSVKDIVDLIYKQNADIAAKSQNYLTKEDIYDLCKEISNIRLLLDQINNMMMSMRIESSKNTDGISMLNVRVQNIENSLTITSKNSFR